MHFDIKSCPFELARLAIKEDPLVSRVDALAAPEANMWLEQSLSTPEGVKDVLRYLFCKTHMNTQHTTQKIII